MQPRARHGERSSPVHSRRLLLEAAEGFGFFSDPEGQVAGRELLPSATFIVPE